MNLKRQKIKINFMNQKFDQDNKLIINKGITDKGVKSICSKISKCKKLKELILILK